MRVLVVGGTGLVGSALVDRCQEAGHDVRFTSRDPGGGETLELDKTDPDATRRVVESVAPDAVVDTAAFHDVDACEHERERAWRVNAVGTGNVARAADRAGAHLVYLSTDYVFPGDPADAPYADEDPVAPVNHYAETKYAGEVAATTAGTWTVLRPSVVYGASGGNFATWVAGELDAGNEVGIVDDQVSRPTYAPDLATACLAVVERGVTGRYNATGPTSSSRYEFTESLAAAFGYDDGLVEPISTAELGQDALRPADSSLDSSALYEAIEHDFRGPVGGLTTMAGRRDG